MPVTNLDVSKFSPPQSLARLSKALHNPSQARVAPRSDWFDLGGNRKEPSVETTDSMLAWLQKAGQPQQTPMGNLGVGAFGIVGYRASWNDRPVAIKYAVDLNHRFRLGAEHRFAQWAAHFGFGPAVQAFDGESGVMAIDFVEGGTIAPLKAADPDVREDICAFMAKMHATPWPAPVWEENWVMTDKDKIGIGALLARLAEGEPDAQALGETLAQWRDALITSLHRYAFRPCVVHNDLHYQNLVDSPRGLYPIDWGNAGIGDGARDLAYFMTFAERPADELTAWVRAYERHSVQTDDSLTARVAHHMAVIRITRFLAAHHDDPDSAVTAARAQGLHQSLSVVTPHLRLEAPPRPLERRRSF